MAKAKVVEMPESLRKQTAAAAPSMVPEGIIPPPNKDEEIVPQLNTLVKDKKDYLELKRLIEEDLPWKRMMSEAKKERDKIEKRIKNLLGKHKVGAGLLDHIRISYYSTTRSSVKPHLLLQNGITMEVLQKCTEEKTSYTLKISEGKEEEEE